MLSRELGPKKIRVNTISPGVVETEGTHSGGYIGSEFEKVAIAQTPLGRIGQPGDIASIAVFLASEDSAWLTGEQLIASGGFRKSANTCSVEACNFPLRATSGLPVAQVAISFSCYPAAGAGKPDGVCPRAKICGQTRQNPGLEP